MTFQPVLPLPGYGGWRFLQRTLDRQQDALRQSPAVERATDYFRANIAKATTAKELVGDRRLLEVALGAFGLSADINAKAFLQRVLEGGTLDPKALANRLSDKRYAALAFEFGYGNLGARTGLTGFADKIIARYQQQTFQEAVGEKDNDLRLALNLKNGLQEIVDKTANLNAQWYTLMGNPPLRQVIQTALGLPAATATLDVDKQLGIFKARAQATFGTSRLSDLTEPARQEKLIRLFLLRSEPQGAPATTSTAAVLQLLGRGG